MKHQFVALMAKHLPPSASTMRLLDIGGDAGELLASLRSDLDIQTASLHAAHWDYNAATIDAVTAYDILIDRPLLAAIMDVLRPGGRFIAVNPLGHVDQSHVKMLEEAGYIRILVEPALPGAGVLMRGERAYLTDNTIERVAHAGQRDSDSLSLNDYTGRYVHLLIRQSPNKPVWRLEPHEQIEWYAAAIEQHNQLCLLGFSSLLKAVNFLQHAVLSNFLTGFNRVGKFKKEVAVSWVQPILLNPVQEALQDISVIWVPVDPSQAETSDE